MAGLLAIAVLAGCSEAEVASPVEAGDQRPAVAAAAPGSIVIGRSARGRPIRAVRIGSPRARIKVLVVGSLHGNEPAGRSIVRRLRRSRPPRGTALWLIEDANPDGSAAGTRHNTRGVDLNRNFPDAWRADGRPFDTYHSGTAPLSEPESQAVAAFVRRVRPRVTLWYHQALEIVVKSAGDPSLQRLYSRRSGLPWRTHQPLNGTATGWQNATFPGDTAFVVELPRGAPSRGVVRRNTHAALAVARAIAPQPEVNRPIPFAARRKEEMRAYARRHYGIDDFRLRRPRVIVQHYTVTDSFEPVFRTFANDVPDVELGELPGVCAHYVIDRDGTVYRLVPTRIMCRHTVGLNWTAIGIEHVGQSDAQVLGSPRQMQASLRLTRMLQGRHGIATRNVIGHAESLSSPFHRERVARLRRQTHGDLGRASMDRYRRLLRRLPAPASMR